ERAWGGVEEGLAGVSGGMGPKLEAAVYALESGVGAAHILDGREPHSLLLELFTDEGIRTKLGPQPSPRRSSARRSCPPTRATRSSSCAARAHVSGTTR